MKAKLRDHLRVSRVEPCVILYDFYAYALTSDTEDNLFHHPLITSKYLNNKPNTERPKNTFVSIDVFKHTSHK